MSFTNESWHAVGASGSNNLSAPGNTAEPQQQPPGQQTPASPPGERNGSFAPSGSITFDNPLWFPPQYVPSGEEIQPDLSLHTHKVVRVFDAGLTPHSGNAILDTGTGCLCALHLSESVGNVGWQQCWLSWHLNLQQQVVAKPIMSCCCSMTVK